MSKELILNAKQMKEAEALVEELSSKGVKKERLNRMQSAPVTNSLPGEGTFESYYWDTESSKNPQYHHLRMKVKGTDQSVSISNLKLMGSLIGGADENHDAVPADGGYRLRIKPINREFSRVSQINLAVALKGRKFKATAKTAKTRQFNADATQVTYETPSEAVKGARVTDCYIVELT
jgi:hypothetical protein